jgi:glycosyltransferase involved in cell wall biosynthesis
VDSKPKVLYLIGQFPAINHGYLLAEILHLRQLGFEIHVASVSPPDRPVTDLTEAEREEVARTFCVKSLSTARITILNALEFFRSPWRYLRGLIFTLGLAGPAPKRIFYHMAYFAEAVVVGRWMRELAITHLHASFSATVALIAARIFPVTWSFGVYGFGELHDPVATHLTERIQSALFVRSISKHGRGQLMLSCDRSQWPKLLYSPLGIDVAGFLPREKSRASGLPTQLLCVGRLSQEKGHALLLEAVASLASQSHELRLHIVGDGPDRRWLELYAKQLGISAHVIFEGWVEGGRLTALYSQTDIFVLPSLAEGIPMVLMEAMAMEIPCVAPRISGIPELIEHGTDGLLFAVADVDALCQAVRTLLDSPEVRNVIGKKGREKVLREYDMARNTERFAALTEKQLNSARAE